MKRLQFKTFLALLFTLIFNLNSNAVSPKIRNGEKATGKVIIPLKPYITLYKIYWKSVFLQFSCQVAKFVCGFEDRPATNPGSNMVTTVPPPTQPPNSGTVFQVIYTVFEDKMNWMEAHVNCKLEGSDLTTVEDDLELMHLQSVISNSNLTMSDFVWTAGNDILRDGNYTWVSTGQSFVDFLPVGNIEPTKLPTEDCVFLYFTPKFNMFVMADYSCDFKAASICKKLVAI